MKLITKILPIAAIAFVGIVSCNDDEDTRHITDNRAILSTTTTAVTIAEGDTETITLTLDKPSSTTLEYRVELIDDSLTSLDTDLELLNPADGEVMEFVDHLYPPFDAFQIEVPPYATEFSFDISAIKDFAVEGTENKTLRILPNKSMFGFVSNDEGILIDVAITNYEQPNHDLTLLLDFEGTTYIDDNGDEVGSCDIDFDFYVYDSGFANYGYSWYDCPEQIIIDENAADGTYYITADLYSLGGPATTTADNQDIPFTIILAKQGIWYEEVHVSGLFNTAQGGSTEGLSPSELLMDFTVVKNGTSFTLVDGDGNDVSTGKMSNQFNRPKK